MQRLDEIVRLLESGSQSMDDTVKLFEEGMKLARECDAQLKKYESEINTIMNQNSGEQA